MTISTVQVAPNIALSAYAGAAAQTIAPGATITVGLDTVQENTAPAELVFAPGVETSRVVGIFLLCYDVGLEQLAVSSSVARAFVEHDTGSGFVEIAGSRSEVTVDGLIPPTAAMRSAQSGTFVATLGAGDALRLRVTNLTGGLLSTIAEASRFTIVRVMQFSF